MDESLIRAYRFARLRGRCGVALAPAIAALEFARAESAMIAERTKYGQESAWRKPFGAAGAPFKVAGYDCRWIEKPESHFRFKGATSELARAEGWRAREWDTQGYYMDTFEHEYTRPVVYQLSAKDGAPRYIAGGHDAFNGSKDGRGAAYLALEVFGDLIAAANAAQTIAERYAQEAREYDESYQRGARAGELLKEAREVHRGKVQALEHVDRHFYGADARTKATRAHITETREYERGLLLHYTVELDAFERGEALAQWAKHPPRTCGFNLGALLALRDD